MIPGRGLKCINTSENGFKALLKGRIELGADASVAAGPVGRTDSANHKAYNGDYTGDEILMGNKVHPSKVTQPFIDALNKYIGTKKG